LIESYTLLSYVVSEDGRCVSFIIKSFKLVLYHVAGMNYILHVLVECRHSRV